MINWKRWAIHKSDVAYAINYVETVCKDMLIEEDLIRKDDVSNLRKKFYESKIHHKVN